MAADDSLYSLRNDLPMSMTIAAFTGISWYIGAEINVSLWIIFKRRRGLYFWSCALCSWGVVLQPLFIILADYTIWENLKGSITMIYLTWLVMVIPQSWMLYSRLHLILRHDKILKYIMAVLIVTTTIFSIPTLVIGIMAQATTNSLFKFNLIWDRIQTTVFFVQETVLSLLYIYFTRQYLRDSSLLSRPAQASVPRSFGVASRPNNNNDNNNDPNNNHHHHHRASIAARSHRSDTTRGIRHQPGSETKQVLHHLIAVNVLVICLDIALLGVQYADMFYLQGAFKPAVYGIKLKVEFAILNRLIEMLKRRARGGGVGGSSSGAYSEGGDLNLFRDPRGGAGGGGGGGSGGGQAEAGGSGSTPKMLGTIGSRPSGRSFGPSGDGLSRISTDELDDDDYDEDFVVGRIQQHEQQQQQGAGGGDTEAQIIQMTPLDQHGLSPHDNSSRAARDRSQESQQPIWDRGPGGS